jgi:hypothetical protein
MKQTATILLSLILLPLLSFSIMAQEVGDYRTQSSGNWSNAAIWEVYNGSAWQSIGVPPTGSGTITILSEDSVYVNTPVSISDTLIHQGIVEAIDSLTITIANGGVYQYDRDEGTMPKCIWAEGSTLLITGVTSTAPEDRDQDYYNLTFNTPDMLSNLNMNLNHNTISGDVHVINSGFSRWYLTSALALDTSVVTILGDVIVEDGAQFSVQGTSNAQTTFIVHHYGNINVNGGNFSISRGSQGGGTTTWYLYEGNFSMSNATTQSSTATPGGAKFVFAGTVTQTLTLGEGNTLTALPIEVAAGATLDMGSSVMAGTGIFNVNAGATLITALDGGINEIFSAVVAAVTLESGSGYGFNGTNAQITSTMMPDTIGGLIIDNAAGVTLSQETVIDGVLRLVNGVFDNTIPFTFGPNGDLIIEGGSLVVDVEDPIPVGIESSEINIPQSFFVGQNYPNPFNPATKIRFGLPSAGYVTAKVFNITGQEVSTLFEGRLNAGEHELTFNGENVSSGVYFYRIEAGNEVGLKRMILLK